MAYRTIRAAIVFVVYFLAPDWSLASDPESDRLRYSLTKAELKRNPVFELEITDSLDPVKTRKWGESAVELCEEWFPVLCKFLDTTNYAPPEVITIAIKKELNFPGATVGTTISVSEVWITQHPDDFGLMIHELVHVVQQYPSAPNKPGWVVEGIADYVRYWKYESERPRNPISDQQSYLDGYGTSASFLAWIVWNYDRRAIRCLDSALRKGEYNDAIFQELTGKDLPQLWAEFIKQEKSGTTLRIVNPGQ